MFIVFNIYLIVLLNYIWFYTLAQIGYSKITKKNNNWNAKKYGEGVKGEDNEVEDKKNK